MLLSCDHSSALSKALHFWKDESCSVCWPRFYSPVSPEEWIIKLMAVAYNFAFCICPVKIFCNTWEDCFLADRVLEIPTQQWGVQYISFPMPQAGKEPNGEKKKGQFLEMENLIRMKMDEKRSREIRKPLKFSGHSPTSLNEARILPPASLNLIPSSNRILNHTADILLPSQGPVNHWNTG